MTFGDIAARLTQLIYQAQVDIPVLARFCWQGHELQLRVPQPDIVAVELCLGYVPFSAENRSLRADVLAMLEAAAIDLQVGLRLAPGGVVWLTAACTSSSPMRFDRLIQLATLNILAVKPIMAYLTPLLRPIPLDRAPIAA